MRQLRSIVTVGVALTVMAGGAWAQEPGSVVAADPRVEGRTYTFPGTGQEVPYALFVPSNYDASRVWPLMVALHGLGRPYDWMMGYDSFIDFDLLAHVDNDGEKILGPSVYSEMVWNARQLRAQAGLKPIDWVVLRNRLGAQQMVNKAKMEKALERLSKRIGFRIVPGFNERVIFRELFPRGLTLLDLKDIGVQQLNISNVAARQELRDLIKALNLPGVTVSF